MKGDTQIKTYESIAWDLHHSGCANQNQLPSFFSGQKPQCDLYYYQVEKKIFANGETTNENLL